MRLVVMLFQHDSSNSMCSRAGNVWFESALKAER